MAFHIVLVEPEIPANTGNIARTCAATDTFLHLVKPLGFSTEDKMLKRAGLDYWEAVNLKYYDCFAEVQAKYAKHTFYYASTKAKTCYADFSFQDGDFFVFGKETKGLPSALLKENADKSMQLPMTAKVRSLNLSNSVAIVLYEALRQNNFHLA